MTIVLVISLLILFLLVKAYFSNSYIYAIQGNDNKSDLNIGAVIDTRLDQFRKPSGSIEQQQQQQNQPVKASQPNSNDHLIIKTLLNNKGGSNNQNAK
jgi:predicted RNA-binding protein (virulence factor B family)